MYFDEPRCLGDEHPTYSRRGLCIWAIALFLIGRWFHRSTERNNMEMKARLEVSSCQSVWNEWWKKRRNARCGLRTLRDWLAQTAVFRTWAHWRKKKRKVIKFHKTRIYLCLSWDNHIIISCCEIGTLKLFAKRNWSVTCPEKAYFGKIDRRIKFNCDM